MSVLLRQLNKPVYLYSSVILISFFILIWSLQLWKADLSIPFVYAGDGLLHGEIIKGIINNGWYLNNYYTGAPFGQEFYDFPISDGLFILMYKLLSLFTSNYALIFNLFYLIGFILTSITSFFVLRHFSVAYWPSLLTSVLFTFTPYHFLRIYHLHLAAYFMIPLIIMVILWTCDQQKPIFYSMKNNKLSFSLKNKRAIISLIICVLTASSGVYYAFFSCVLLGGSLLVAIISKFRFRSLLSMFLLILTMAFTVLLNILPTIINNFSNGKNNGTAVRGFAESEIYGLRISQLIIPVDDHGIEILSKLISRYSGYPISSEGHAYIGLIAVIGLLLSLVYLYKKNNEGPFELINQISLLNLTAILFSTIGGFGSLFSLVVTQQIRAYSRMSIFIAFISLFILSISIDFFIKKYKIQYKIVIPIMVLLMIFGVIDQTGSSFIPQYDYNKDQYIKDKKYFETIESELSKDSMVLQLPYVPFPENPSVVNMTDYEHFKGYLHTKNLRWSYGAMKGRTAADWLKDISSNDTAQLIQKASYAGFEGIYIDRYGYVDGGLQIEKELSDILQQQPLESEDKRRSFYNLTSYNKHNKSQYTDEEWSKISYDTLHTVIVDWRNTSVEGTKENNWRWFPNEAVLDINNTSDVEQTISLDMSFISGEIELSSLSITSDFFEDNLMISSEGKQYKRKLTVPPGKHEILIQSNAKRIYAPEDARYLVFRIANFKWEKDN
ncbi:phosphoglycerol transferase [Paenibacillus algorifonticola]|uniref:Phosphoglycerol transferase n=1 Tax=Paenibacillus algorifonticola TaxID=684063 RepID=A0A1I2E0H6_9BACL|nr:hypothetical protein [Paenibacillus algorifonticola]SFE86189.1 phosphoglycerol transferase [Paenibacillus algorifonticola]